MTTIGQSGGLKFLLDTKTPTALYDRVGLLAATIGWRDVLDMYNQTSESTVRTVIEDFIVAQIISGNNQALIQTLDDLNQLKYVKLFVKINANAQFAGGMSNLLIPQDNDISIPFWKNTAPCWLVRESQIAEIESLSGRSVIKRASDFVAEILDRSAVELASIVGYGGQPFIPVPKSSALPPFDNLDSSTAIDLKALFSFNKRRNLAIIISEPIHQAFGTDDLTKLFANTDGVIVILELATSSVQKNIYTKYGLDTYHIRTVNSMVLDLLFDDPDYVFKNIYRF